MCLLVHTAYSVCGTAGTVQYREESCRLAELAEKDNEREVEDREEKEEAKKDGQRLSVFVEPKLEHAYSHGVARSDIGDRCLGFAPRSTETSLSHCGFSDCGMVLWLQDSCQATGS